jgi:hypothetical protein
LGANSRYTIMDGSYRDDLCKTMITDGHGYCSIRI